MKHVTFVQLSLRGLVDPLTHTKKNNSCRSPPFEIVKVVENKRPGLQLVTPDRKVFADEFF